MFTEIRQRLSMRPNYAVKIVILDYIENWCKEYRTRSCKYENENCFLKIKSQFLLVCYDWAAHWDNHRKKKPPVRHRSCDDEHDNTNVVYHAFTATF